MLGLVAALGLAAFLVISIWSSYELYQARADYEAVFGEPDLLSLAPVEPASEENAATWLVAGANAIVGAPKTAWLTRLSRTPASEWSDEDRERAQELIEVNRPALTLLERASAGAGSSFGIDYDNGAYAQLPDFLALLRAHKMVAIKARSDFADGDVTSFREALTLMSSFTRALSGETLLISTLVVLTLDLDYFDQLQEAIAAGVDDPYWLVEIQLGLENRNRRDLLWRSLAADGAVAESLTTATVQDAMPERITGFGSGLPGILGRPATRSLQASFLRAPTETAAWIDRPYSQWLAGQRELQPPGLRWAGNSFTHGNPMNTVARLQATETVRRLALEAMRLSLARSKTGSYPTEDHLPETDPFSGSPCLRSNDPSGGAQLECPGALKLFGAAFDKRVESANLFSWRLPG